MVYLSLLSREVVYRPSRQATHRRDSICGDAIQCKMECSAGRTSGLFATLSASTRMAWNAQTAARGFAWVESMRRGSERPRKEPIGEDQNRGEHSSRTVGKHKCLQGSPFPATA